MITFLALVYALQFLGLVCAGTYLAINHPRHMLTASAVNANGWVIIILLYQVRALVLIYLQGGGRYLDGLSYDDIFSMVMLAVTDSLIVIRLWSFLNYRRSYNQALRESPAQPVAE